MSPLLQLLTSFLTELAIQSFDMECVIPSGFTETSQLPDARLGLLKALYLVALVTTVITPQ